MFQRFVFPIFNTNNQIHGFSGRIMSKSSTAPKWKHIGVKSKWIYPHNLSLNEIQKKQEVILVESIGDVLSLFENGYKNILCTFGVDISPSLISYLVGINPKKIIISFNNDKLSKNNAGKNGAIKNFLKLQNFLDNQKIYIHLPTKNDFGEMNSEDFTEWSNKLLEVEKHKHDLNIIKDVNKILSSEQGKSAPKSYINNFKKFKKIYE
jgi:DNA primase